MPFFLVLTKKTTTFAPAFADMAQLVEQRIRNAWVPGSSPGIGSNSGGGTANVSPIVFSTLLRN